MKTSPDNNNGYVELAHMTKNPQPIENKPLVINQLPLLLASTLPGTVIYALAKTKEALTSNCFSKMSFFMKTDQPTEQLLRSTDSPQCSLK